MESIIGSALSELHITEEGSGRGRMGRRRYSNDDTREFKSKNLFAERKRREKLSGRLLALRALVPFITNVINHPTLLILLNSPYASQKFLFFQQPFTFSSDFFCLIGFR